jgi:hypothetical protein
MGLNLNVLRSFDAKAHSIASDFKNSDLDIAGHDNLFVFFPTNDEHALVSKPPRNISLIKREPEGRQKYKKDWGATSRPKKGFNSFKSFCF